MSTIIDHDANLNRHFISTRNKLSSFNHTQSQNFKTNIHETRMDHESERKLTNKTYPCDHDHNNIPEETKELQKFPSHISTYNVNLSKHTKMVVSKVVHWK